MGNSGGITSIVKRGANVVRVAVRRLVQTASTSMSPAQLYVLLSRLTGGRSELSESYAQCTTVYAGVTAIAQTLASMPMTLHRGDPSKPITGGPAWTLLNAPYPGCDWPMLCEQIGGHLVESGEAHVFDPNPVNVRPANLIAVGKRQMTPEVRGGRLLWWWFDWQPFWRRVPITPDLDGFRKLFHPYDPLRGLSPLAAAAIDVRQSYLAGSYNAAMLENGGAPGGVYTVPGQLSEQEKEELRKTIKERHERPENANRPLLGWGGLDYKSIAGRPVDLDLKELLKFNREQILSALGVPPVLAGVFESAHYDVADQAIIIFLIHKLSPLGRSIEALFNTQILPRIEPGVLLKIDTTAHPAMLSLVTKKIEAQKKAIDNGTPYNEAAALVGLELKKQTWGDRSLVPGGLAPIEDVLAGGTGLAPDEGIKGTRDQGIEGEDKEQEETKDDGPEAHATQRETAAAIATERREEERLIRAHVPRFRNAMRAHFSRQHKLILTRLSREMKSGDTPAWLPPWEKAADENERIAAKVLLSITDEASKLKLLVRNNFPAAVEAALREKLAAMGWDKAEIDKAVKRLMDGKTIRALVRIKEGKIAGIERVTHTRVKKQILEGLSKGETVTEISDRVRIALGGTDAARALTIARTEVGQAVSTGRHLAMKTAGVTGKSWIKGRNPRPSHELAQLEYGPSSPIAIDQLFHVGESYLLYPRDPRGAAGEIINCNCVQVPRRLKAASEKVGT